MSFIRFILMHLIDTKQILIELGCCSCRIDAVVINRHMNDQYDQFYPVYATQYALRISCFAFFNIVNGSVDVSLTQNALNNLFVLIFFAFSSWICKATGDGQFCYFRRLVIPLKTRLRYPGLLYKKEEWSYLDFWQPTSQTYPQHCLLIRAL